MLTAVAHSARSVLTTGYLALDAVLYNERAALRAGGTAGNVAANLAFLGWDALVVGRISADAAGEKLTEDLSQAGVQLDFLEARRDASTPVVFHHVTHAGPRYSFRCPKCGRKLGRHSPPDSELVSRSLHAAKQHDVFFFDRASKGALQLGAAAKEAGALVFFEPSTIGTPHLFSQAVELAHIVKYSDERARAVESALPRRPNRQLRIVTRGAAGLSVSIGRAWHHVPPFSVHTSDTAGAGDWTTAAFLFALPTLEHQKLEEESLVTALRFAQAVAAASCHFIGARGMTLSWKRSRVLSVARALVNGSSTDVRPRQRAAGQWHSEHTVLATLCGQYRCG